MLPVVTIPEPGIPLYASFVLMGQHGRGKTDMLVMEAVVCHLELSKQMAQTQTQKKCPYFDKEVLNVAIIAEWTVGMLMQGPSAPSSSFKKRRTSYQPIYYCLSV